jgi:transposase
MCREVEHVATPKGSAARAERAGTGRTDAAQPLAQRPGRVGRPGHSLAGPDGQSYLAAARQAGRRDNDTVAAWVARFNREGLPAVRPRHGGPSVRYGAAAQQRILAEVRRPPDRERDGTATWSLSTLQRALPRAGDGLARVSTYTIWKTLHAAGLSWQHSRTWCETGVVLRKRKQGGPVVVRDPDAVGKNPDRAGVHAWCRTRPGGLV